MSDMRLISDSESVFFSSTFEYSSLGDGVEGGVRVVIVVAAAVGI
jgi:hypothetical protein